MRIFLFRLVLSVCVILSWVQPVSSGEEQLETLRRQDQNAFPRRYEIDQARTLIRIRETISEMTPDSEQALVGLAYAYFWLGNRLSLEEGTKKERLQLYQSCIGSAREAIRINPLSTGGNFWTVICQGRYTQTHGILGGTFGLGNSIRGMQVVAANNESYYYAGVNRFWGRVCYEVPGIIRRVIDFSLEDSVYFLMRAIEIAPDFLMNHRYLAETYLKMDRTEEARQSLALILTRPADKLPEAEAENLREQEIARRIWRKNFTDLPLPKAPSE